MDRQIFHFIKDFRGNMLMNNLRVTKIEFETTLERKQSCTFLGIELIGGNELSESALKYLGRYWLHKEEE